MNNMLCQQCCGSEKEDRNAAWGGGSSGCVITKLSSSCLLFHQALSVNNWTFTKPLNGLLVSKLDLYLCIFHSPAAGSFENANQLHTHLTPLKAHQWFPSGWNKT